ncbi:hypothetical protein ACO2Q8_15825 [Larkinella sp. VNQ87]|uniref:hypothetical protein n=1 Tax=Larkinella sp. VNQ87 TaxID=3400921 RepID=UPI003C091668
MNTFVKSTLSVLGISLLASLSSCTNNEAIKPLQSNGTTPYTETAPQPTQVNNLLPTLQTYRLVKHGDWQLFYDEQGDLVKLQSTAEPNYRREYTRASNGTGMTIQLFNGYNLWRKTLILFDAKGRCKESFITNYSVVNGKTVATTRRFSYQYNAANQLIKMTNLDNAGHYLEFLYNDNNDLVVINIKKNGKWEAMTYGYKPAGEALIKDYTRLNPIWMTLHEEIDPFLPIYGKFNKNLVRLFHYDDKTAGKSLEKVSYNYSFNRMGLVTSQEEIRFTAGQTLTQTINFGYQFN